MNESTFDARTPETKLDTRLYATENRVRDFLMKRRELLIIELSYIEDELGIPRTKEKRTR